MKRGPLTAGGGHSMDLRLFSDKGSATAMEFSGTPVSGFVCQKANPVRPIKGHGDCTNLQLGPKARRAGLVSAMD